MRRVGHWWNWLLNSKYRKKTWYRQLDFIRMQIINIKQELMGRDELVFRIHKEAVDKDSEREIKRYQQRKESIRNNENLFKEYYKKEKILLQKLGLL